MSLTLSVITICFNNLPELTATCKSVDEQTVFPTEHIIIDGSTNNEINKWLTDTSQPSYRKWIFERDEGISDAFNKGIRNASGEITHLLNSGDTYAGNNIIELVLNCFAKSPELSWVHGKYIQHRGNIDIVSGAPFDRNQLWKGMRQVAHPTMFIKKSVYIKNGYYNLDYKIAMDYDMLVRMRDETNYFLDHVLVYFAPGGASNKQFYLGLKEVQKSYRKHIGFDFRQVLWQTRQKLLQVFMGTRLGRIWFQLKNRRNRIS